MQPAELAKLVDRSKCRVFGWDDAGNDGQRAVLAALIRGFDARDSTILCEPSLAGKTTRPPDAVLIDPLVGVHVVEVKAVSLEQIEEIQPGGILKIRYASGPRNSNPIAQVRNAMFDIKDATQRACEGEMVVPFRYSVALPMITRPEWIVRWGEEGHCPPEFVFGDDLVGFPEMIRAQGRKHLGTPGLSALPSAQFASIWKAFGDSSVLYHLPEDREARRVPKATLAELFEEAAEAYKTLSDDQQRLSAQNWSGGPRLVRGVAGSGKTIVLANNMARKLQKALRNEESLFEEANDPQRILAVCYNRTLVPFLRQKIAVAFQQRTGRTLPDDALEVTHYNRLLWRLSQQGLWRYHAVDSGDDETRVKKYLTEFEHSRQNHPDLVGALLFDAIYVDEGQDFHEDDFRLLKNLCRTPEGGEPNLYIFYDDAQNFLGRSRPRWKSLGLNLNGRSNVMTDCFRNTRPIVEAAFNVLYGRFADAKQGVPNKDFGDLAALEEKGLISDEAGRFKIRFALRDGMTPRVSIADDIDKEDHLLIERLRWLLEDQHVRPEDILLLAHHWRRIERLASIISQAEFSSVDHVHIARQDQDRSLRRRGCLSLSTVASAKGYDAYCTLLASANQFPVDLSGRATFYVGCTRAIEYLEVFAHERTGLVVEFEKAVLSGSSSPA